jgi:excisionase family DNA binding protein
MRNDPDYYTTEEAAERLRISQNAVVRRIERKQLQAVKLGGRRWFIPRAVVDALAREPAPQGI